jgi:hypothetical protein
MMITGDDDPPNTNVEGGVALDDTQPTQTDELPQSEVSSNMDIDQEHADPASPTAAGLDDGEETSSTEGSLPPCGNNYNPESTLKPLLGRDRWLLTSLILPRENKCGLQAILAMALLESTEYTPTEEAMGAAKSQPAVVGLIRDWLQLKAQATASTPDERKSTREVQTIIIGADSKSWGRFA